MKEKEKTIQPPLLSHHWMDRNNNPNITNPLSNALQQIEKLEAEKKELLEALEQVKLYGKPICNDSGDGIIIDFETMDEIESLIQKHKQ